MDTLIRRATLPAALALLALTSPASAQLSLPRVSPNASVTQTIGITDVTVKYCRPGVKSRVIWGELVPYGQPWRTGANEATDFTTTDDLTVNGQKLAAGTYALFTIPGEAELDGGVQHRQGDVGRVRVQAGARRAARAR